MRFNNNYELDFDILNFKALITPYIVIISLDKATLIMLHHYG